MLEGIRILDLTRYFPGPFASLRLQERGAEVIKVEDPNGDPARVMDRLDGEEGVIFRSMSRGKPCVCVNLKDPAEREKFYALVSTADALIESFRPGVTAKLGIDYPTLSKLNPRLVYVSVTGYGQTGTYRALAGHDLNYLAMSGVMDQLLDDERIFHVLQLEMRCALVRGMDDDRADAEDALEQPHAHGNIRHAVQQRLFYFHADKPCLDEQTVFGQVILRHADGHSQNALAVLPDGVDAGFHAQASRFFFIEYTAFCRCGQVRGLRGSEKGKTAEKFRNAEQNPALFANAA